GDAQISRLAFGLAPFFANRRGCSLRLEIRLIEPSRPDLVALQLREHRCHCVVWIKAKRRSSETDKLQAAPFEVTLPRRVSVEAVLAVPVISITLDGDPPSHALDHEID